MLGVTALTSLARRREAELRLAARIAAAAGLAYAAAKLLGMAQGYWVVLTSVIVMQASLGGSLKAAADRMAGTLAGAAWGGIVAVLIPHHDHLSTELAILVAVTPVALLAAIRSSFRVAPITALIVLLPTGGAIPESPLLFALERVGEIALGNVVGVAVAVVILPSRAHNLLLSSAAKLADLNADLMTALMDGLMSETGRPNLAPVHARIRSGLKQLESAADEAARERRGHLTGRGDPEPLVRTLYRVRHDLVMVGRAASKPLPPDIAPDLQPCIMALRDAGVSLMRCTAQAFRTESFAPETKADAVSGFEASLKAYAGRMDALRAEGRTRPLSSEDVARLYTLRFALEQFGLDLGDLADRAGEHVADVAG